MLTQNYRRDEQTPERASVSSSVVGVGMAVMVWHALLVLQHYFLVCFKYFMYVTLSLVVLGLVAGAVFSRVFPDRSKASKGRPGV